jgi:DNA-binding transcriptional LysR family regulator
MNISDIEAFVAVAEAGSVNRGARRLHLTQPAVTRRLQNFEANLGQVVLLDRSAKPPVLTPLGRQVLESCRRVLRAVEELEATPSSGEPTGEFRIGIAHGLTEMMLISPLDELRQHYPRVRLRINANWTAWLIQEVRSGALDCAIVLIDDHTHMPSGVTVAALGAEKLVVVAGQNLSLPTARRPIRLHDLAVHGWILNPLGCGYRSAVQRVFDREGLALDVAAEVFGHDLQLSLVARGAGLTIAPRRTFEAASDRRRLRIVKVQHFELQFTIALLHGGSLGSLASVVDWLQGRIARQMTDYKKRAS